MFYSAQTNGFYSTEIHGNAIPADAVEITESEHATLLAGQSQGKTISAGMGGVPHLSDPAPMTQIQVIAQYESALDNHLDDVAKQYRYKDRFSLAIRAGYAGPYHDEAVAFAQWMDGCNVQAFALLADVVAGNAPMPTVEAFIAGLPEFALP